MIITNPAGTLFSTGTYLNAEEKAMLISAVTRIGKDFFAAGTTIAINIAYIDIPSAETMTFGKILPAIAPRSVPIVHPT